jgi:hypothetical protein
MYYEKLALEVGATVAGLEVMNPPTLSGASGVQHRFSFAAAEEETVYGFDMYNEVGEIEIIKSYIKKMDTGARVFVVCLSGHPGPQAAELARNYDMVILGPKEVGDFFEERIARQIQGPAKRRSYTGSQSSRSRDLV